VLRIRESYPGSWIRNKKFKYFYVLTQNIVTKLLAMFISGPGFFSIPDPGLDSGVRKALDLGSQIRIWIRNTGYEYLLWARKVYAAAAEK